MVGIAVGLAFWPDISFIASVLSIILVLYSIVYLILRIYCYHFITPRFTACFTHGDQITLNLVHRSSRPIRLQYIEFVIDEGINKIEIPDNRETLEGRISFPYDLGENVEISRRASQDIRIKKTDWENVNLQPNFELPFDIEMVEGPNRDSVIPILWIRISGNISTTSLLGISSPSILNDIYGPFRFKPFEIRYEALTPNIWERKMPTSLEKPYNNIWPKF